MEQQILAQLQDIKIPDAVGYWPLSIGWWLVLVLTLICLVSVTVWVVRFKRLNRPRKQAIALLTKLPNSTASAKAGYINEILKRFFLAYGPRERVANLTGSDWLTHLTECAPNHNITEQQLTMAYQQECTDEQVEQYRQAVLTLFKAIPSRVLKELSHV